jgi:hypothetical protein
MRRIVPIASFVLFCAGFARAEGEIPSGFVKIEKIGAVQIHMVNAKWTSKTEFTIRLNELHKALNEFWKADAEMLGPAAPASKFEARKNTPIDLVLFDNEAEHDDFMMKNGAVDFTRPGRPPGTIYLPLVDGKVPKEGWEKLTRMLSRAYAWHGMYFGPPPWLDLGMAEYFALGNKYVKPAESDTYIATVERLHEVGSRGAEKAIADTLLGNGTGWSKEDNDNAWCLCHVLMTECKPTALELRRILGAQQACAMDRLDGIVNDGRKLAKFELDQAFGSAEALQSAWAWHRDALVKGGPSIAKLKNAPGSLKDAYFTGLKFTTLVKSAFSTKVLTSGAFAYGVPWPGPISVRCALAARNEGFGGEMEIEGGRSDKQLTQVRWKEEEVPLISGCTRMRMTVTWEVDGGGVYQDASIAEVRIPAK